MEKSTTKQYFYFAQLRKYIVQVMAVFGDLQVSVGKTGELGSRLINVPIYYGSKDKVVASIKAEGSPNKPIRIPCISAKITGIELAPDMRKNIGGTRRSVHMPISGMFSEDIKVVHQYQPIPYKLNIELVIYSSNTDQNHQILEQILVLFDPTLQLQTSDELFDWTKITTIELTGINLDENYPINADRRIIQNTLQFQLPVYIAIPDKIKKDYVARVKLRIGAIGDNTDASRLDADGILQQLDDNNLKYQDLFSLDDLEAELDNEVK